MSFTTNSELIAPGPGNPSSSVPNNRLTLGGGPTGKTDVDLDLLPRYICLRVGKCEDGPELEVEAPLAVGFAFMCGLGVEAREPVREDDGEGRNRLT